jgi:hypothetical protein
MKETPKSILYIILIGIFVYCLFSCKTTQTITKIEKQFDTIRIEKTLTDTVFQEKTIEKTREIKSNVFLPCPKEGEKGSKGESKSGDNHSKWEYDKEQGGYNIELYCAEQINQKDSIIKKLTIEIDTYKSKVSEKETDTKIITEKSHWWQSFLKNIWKVLFFTVAILWVFGITPKFIIKKLI